jgi:uncharacterized hydrophobic protein (TIGR00341 family)
LHIPVPEEEVEAVLEELYQHGLDSDDHVVVIKAAVDIFGRADDTATATDDYQRIAAAELEGQTEDLIPDDRTFVTMMILSTIVASTGLLLDSAAVVVGSMVIAPLFGPAISASVGTVIDKSDLFRRGVRLQALGVVIAIVSATVFAWTLKNAYLVPSGFAVTSAPQIAQRLSPDLLSLVVALVAGIAGVLSISTGAGMALVGVMMAAALLPPAATVGIGIAWGESVVAIQSGVLLAVNVLAINFAGLVTLWYLGYRPQSWVKIPQTRRTLLRRGGTLLVAILVVSAFLASVTYASVQRSQVKSSVEDSVSERLATPVYENVTLLDVKVVQDQRLVTRQIERVIITVGHPPTENHPNIHRNITQSVHEQVGRNITVTIRVSLLVTVGENGSNEVRDRQYATTGADVAMDPPAFRSPASVFPTRRDGNHEADPTTGQTARA